MGPNQNKRWLPIVAVGIAGAILVIVGGLVVVGGYPGAQRNEYDEVVELLCKTHSDNLTPSEAGTIERFVAETNRNPHLSVGQQRRLVEGVLTYQKNNIDTWVPSLFTLSWRLTGQYPSLPGLYMDAINSDVPHAHRLFDAIDMADPDFVNRLNVTKILRSSENRMLIHAILSRINSNRALDQYHEAIRAVLERNLFNAEAQKYWRKNMQRIKADDEK